MSSVRAKSRESRRRIVETVDPRKNESQNSERPIHNRQLDPSKNNGFMKYGFHGYAMIERQCYDPGGTFGFQPEG